MIRQNEIYIPNSLTETAIESLSKLNGLEPKSTRARIKFMKDALLIGLVLPSCADRARKTIENLKRQIM